MILQLLQDLKSVAGSGQAVAYTALVETRGSTPQKPGAVMLVFPDGSQRGTLGGGCVEAEVKRESLRMLDHGVAGILTFQLDNDYGWDDGLICGGRMQMLVDPVHPNENLGYFDEIIHRLSAGTGCTKTIVLNKERAGGGRRANRHLFDADGNVVASRPVVSAPPQNARKHLRSLASRPRPYVADGIAYLPHLERMRLVIVGAGHVGQKVAELAAQVDFDVWVIDDREEYCNPGRLPNAKRLIVAPIDRALSGLDVDSSTFCVIVTRGHNHDEEALYHLAETPAAYVGMIGSKRKIKLIFDDLLREGISLDALAKIRAPLGFHIGSQSIPEIAVSIVAELIAHRNLPVVPDKYRAPALTEQMTELP